MKTLKNKIADLIPMSIEITQEEKDIAEIAIRLFKVADKEIKLASDYLNVLKTTFEELPDIKPSDVFEARASMWVFRDKAIEKFNIFKISAFKCVNVMGKFQTDPAIMKLVNSFINSVDELEIVVNDFSDLFNNLESKTFVTDFMGKIKSIQSKVDDISDIIKNSIKKHLQEHILGTTWFDALSKDKNLKVKKWRSTFDILSGKEDSGKDTE
jgi:hypothetical protein